MSKGIKLQVTYSGKPVNNLDKKICDFFSSIGFVWYAQGYDFTTSRRDINFDGEKR